MDWRLRSFVTASLLVACVVPAFADVAPGPPPARKRNYQAPVVIQKQELGEGNEQLAARIIIPRDVLEEALGASAPVGSSDNNSGLPPAGTVVAGVLLAVAIASIPFALRGRRYARPLVATAAVTLVVFGGWAIAMGDIAIPGAKRNRPPRPAGRQFIQIEVTDQQDAPVRLTVRP